MRDVSGSEGEGGGETNGDEEPDVHDEDLANPFDQPPSALDARTSFGALLPLAQSLDQHLEQSQHQTSRDRKSVV